MVQNDKTIPPRQRNSIRIHQRGPLRRKRKRTNPQTNHKQRRRPQLPNHNRRRQHPHNRIPQRQTEGGSRNLTPITIEKVRARAEADANTYGYHLTPDPELLQGFLEGLKTNEERYGYPSCPCRLASGKFEFDRDIICPCDYRDPDVAEFGACYCRLYVNKQVYESKELPTVPERRPMEKQALSFEAASKPIET